MELIIDPDVKAVAEFMQQNISTTKLVAVADRIRALAPILWDQYETESVAALRLREPSIEPPEDIRAASTL